ncbi:MAG TPA: nucleoside hydrolase [Oculatellaceae cyanobacterium]
MAKPVIHNHDGHVDDILGCVLLWLSPEVSLQAIGITNGDCYFDQAYESMLKIATYLDLEGPEIAVSEDEMPHPFPDNWRRESYIINELPLFSANDFKKPYQQGKGRRIETAFADCLNHSKAPVTVVITCPMTNLANTLREQPSLKSKIAEVITMSGAVHVPGNVDEEGCDGSAEWNIYADPIAFKEVLESVPSVTMIPLDVTNELKVTPEFLARLEEQVDRSKASMLAFKLFSLVKGFEYYFWDTVTAAALVAPQIFTFKEMKLDVTTQGKSQGRVTGSIFGGRKVKVALQADREKFEDLVLSIFARN